MVNGQDLAKAGCKYLGTPYSVIDCQAFVERCLRDCGNRTDLPGSNAWYRKVKAEGWVGTPEECKQRYGTVPAGAFLFILEHDGKEPAKYQGDGIGNASHIGICTNLSGSEMVKIAKSEGDAIAAGFDFGDGAIHSSASRGAVCTSKFAGKTINGGWNQVGLWLKVIDYGLDQGGTQVDYQAKVVGGALNLREQPSKASDRLCQIPDGSIITVTDEALEWAKTAYSGYVGWVLKSYLEKVQGDDDTVTVSRKWLESIYDQLGDVLGRRG